MYPWRLLQGFKLTFKALKGKRVGKKMLGSWWSHLEYAPLSLQALLEGVPAEFPASLQLLIPVPTLWS